MLPSQVGQEIIHYNRSWRSCASAAAAAEGELAARGGCKQEALVRQKESRRIGRKFANNELTRSSTGGWSASQRWRKIKRARY